MDNGLQRHAADQQKNTGLKTKSRERSAGINKITYIVTDAKTDTHKRPRLLTKAN